MSDEPTERDVDAANDLWMILRRDTFITQYAERIAQARREAWNEGWLTGFANCDERSPATPNPYRPAALRGDAP